MENVAVYTLWSSFIILHEENRMKPPVTYSHPKSVIVMIHMTGGTEMPFRSDGSSYAEATSEARSGVEKRAGFRFLVHRSFLILMGRRESAHPSGYVSDRWFHPVLFFLYFVFRDNTSCVI